MATPVSVPTVTVTPQIVPVTNYFVEYDLKTKDSTKADVQVVGTAVNTFFPGVGGLVSTGATALLGLWGFLRGISNTKRSTATSETLVQQVETIREFIKSLPEGAKYDTAITAWLQAHQVETGTSTQILDLLANVVDNPAAKVAAQELRNTIAVISK